MEDTTTNKNIMKDLYFNTINKNELETLLDYDSLQKYAYNIIKNFGTEYYYHLEKILILKKITQEKVSIDYFKSRFNVYFLLRHKEIISNTYGQDEFDNWFNQYK